MKRGWYLCCSDCGCEVFVSRWRWLAKLISNPWFGVYARSTCVLNKPVDVAWKDGL
jgi:hypothetical protein